MPCKTRQNNIGWNSRRSRLRPIKITLHTKPPTQPPPHQINCSIPKSRDSTGSKAECLSRSFRKRRPCFEGKREIPPRDKQRNRGLIHIHPIKQRAADAPLPLNSSGGTGSTAYRPTRPSGKRCPLEEKWQPLTRQVLSNLFRTDDS
ncbi:hypothetical protein CHS0354_014183 [Potamilus streckersoni]|uniref:Uncharacterized protein n=1 Tax=Potamilus streckersoni TaxID=2493646 RepID=A0AAE0SN17_9BIVA|nr:hypothetical protein CHS0354_014183 [Potamilus streckersoni]